MAKNCYRGFTLIELLVVISIIALLISLLLPALGAARQSAELITCLSNQKQMTLAAVQYADAYEQYLPVLRYGFNEFGFTRHVGPMNRLTYMNVIPELDSTNPYKSGNIRFCPTLAPLRPSSSVSSDDGGIQSMAHYAFSMTVTGYSHATNGITVSHKRMVDIKKPSSVYLLTEGDYWPATNKVASVVDDQATSRRFQAGAEYDPSAPSYWPLSGNVQNYRHGVDRVNFSFADGHGETRSWDGGTLSFGAIHFVDHQ